MVIAIGFGSIAGGVWQLRYGKPNKVIVLVIVGLAVLLYVAAQAYTHSKPRLNERAAIAGDLKAFD